MLIEITRVNSTVRNVPIPFPEIQEAVDAQLRFAAENPEPIILAS